MSHQLRVAVVCLILSSPWSHLAVCTAADGPRLTFSCAPDNDLFTIVSAAVSEVQRFDTPSGAVDAAEEGTGVLILADEYPARPTPLEAALFDRAAEKKLRLYVEYPAMLPGVDVGKPVGTHVERAVVASEFFGGDLQPLRIVSINGLHYVPVPAERPHVVAARVAGFDSAVYGLPDRTAPILFEMPGRSVLVSTTGMSRFVTGRYAPQDAWHAVWKAVLGWLSPGARVPALEWTPTVHATYGPSDPLPEDYELRAIRRGIAWYGKSKMIVHPSFEKQVAGIQRIEPLPADAPVGDGSLGAMEAVLSIIRQDGTQMLSSVRRGDCVCESSMAFALAGRALDDAHDNTIAANLLDYYLFDSIARKNERADPDNGNFGLIAWGVTTPAWSKANYGDDNARQILGTLATAAVNGEGRWDEAMMMCLLANLRTTGQYGFRTSRIDVGPLSQNGWQRYFRGRPVNYAPHFECYLWACYLWAYEQTGYELFLDRAETALKMTMAQYTDGWRWTNGLAQEKARIVLPLAWLVRAKDTPENRAMLRTAVDGLIALQDESGAIREELGLPGHGAYPPPQSNAAYGTNEASLIAKNGDPVSDLLYTTNFAFLALHEAAAATGDADVVAAEDKLAEFLCRIQVASDAQPAVDGGWFRAFDFGRWEHWGSNADHGWGAWSIESGWTQGWIVSVLAMRQMETSLWDLTNDSKIERHFDRLRKQMIPDDVLEQLEPQKVGHAAAGKPVTLATEPDPIYQRGGAAALCDGVVGAADHTDFAWLGWQGPDLVATVDLGQVTEIRTLALNAMQSAGVGIFLPKTVEFAVSTDGKKFDVVATLTHDESTKTPGPLTCRLTAGGLDVRARYVRVKGTNIGTIPAWHRSAGVRAWLFADEILVNPVPQKK